MIQTRTLKFWGMKAHPFRDQPLVAESLSLFVNRKKSLDDAEDALAHSRVIGIHGKLGVGKSSFLRKFAADLVEYNLPTGYVKLTSDSEPTLYRELLAELLILIKEGRLKLKRSPKIDADAELARLSASVTESRGANFGAKIAGLGGDFKEGKTMTVPAHSEASARNTLTMIFKALSGPLVIILDDFEQLRYETSGQTRDYFPILSRFVATLEESFCRDDLVFIVSMDDEVQGHIKAAQQRGGQFAFSLNSLIEIPSLPLTEIIELIKVRLKSCAWDKTLGSFMTQEAFWALLLAGGRNPRKCVRILAEAMKHSAVRNSTHQLVTEDIQAGTKDCDSPFNEKHLVVVSHLLKAGRATGHDDDLREALRYERPKTKGKANRSVERRLSEVHDLLELEIVKEPVAQTSRNVYKLKALAWK